jgi:hypothetical protein
MPKTVTIESVLCRLEMKELDAAADKYEDFFNALLAAQKQQFFVTNGQLVSGKKKREPMTLREFGLILTRVGLEAVRASEEEDDEE